MNDWPMPQPPPYPADDEGSVWPPGFYTHGELTSATHPGLFAVIARWSSPPPPDVWEFYREHGRWPAADEA